MSDSSESEYDTEDDEDYIPVEPSSEEDIEQETSRKGKTKKKLPARKKRKRGIKLDEEDEVSSPEDSEDDDDIEDDTTGGVEDDKKDDLASKQRVDELWEAFKQDTAAVRPAISSSIKQNIGKKVDEKQEGQGLTSSSDGKKEETEVSKKVEVTEIFDFAGEEVKVVKSVDASSIKPAACSDEDKTTLKPKTALPMKRPGGGLGSVLGKIGKKPKLSTLEKSKLDWNSFKKEEGIEDELKMSNRDGYLEKQAFLSRVDHKQFEIERDVREAMRKK